MGLLDNLKKAAASVVEQVEHSGVLDKMKGAAQEQVWGCGSADPHFWIRQADVAEITGVPVGPGTAVETDETFGIRFDGSDSRGAFSFEIHCVDEDVIGRYAGCPRWIDAHAAAHERHSPVSTFGDYTVVAADGDSDFWFYAWVTDSVFSAEAHTRDRHDARV